MQRYYFVVFFYSELSIIFTHLIYYKTVQMCRRRWAMFKVVTSCNWYYYYHKGIRLLAPCGIAVFNAMAIEMNILLNWRYSIKDKVGCSNCLLARKTDNCFWALKPKTLIPLAPKIICKMLIRTFPQIQNDFLKTMANKNCKKTMDRTSPEQL